MIWKAMLSHTVLMCGVTAVGRGIQFKITGQTQYFAAACMDQSLSGNPAALVVVTLYHRDGVIKHALYGYCL